MIDGPRGIDSLIPDLAKAKTEAQKKEIVAREFLALFLRELLKEVNNSAERLFGKGFASEVYKSLFEMELARAMAKSPELKDAFLREIKDFGGLSDKKVEGLVPSGKKNKLMEEGDED